VAGPGIRAHGRPTGHARTLARMNRDLGPLVVLVGLAVVAIGALIAVGGLSWFGRLPGDIRHDAGSSRVFVPITSMIVVSVVLTIVVNVVGRFLR
jgi:hypothetical protein